MTNPHDKIDDWLSREVTPLYPPSGSLDRIRHQARRRKARQAVLTAAACAVAVAAAVTVPQVISATSQHTTNRPIAAGPKSPVIRPTAVPSATTGSGSPLGDAIQFRQHTSLSTTTSGTVPPRHFRPTSVTVVGTGTGGLVGAVIGQAGPPCATADCTSLAGTSTYGNRWYGVSAPIVPGAQGSSGVSQLRFSNLRDGWAFGPQLWATTGGGWPWYQVPTNGLRVTDLEAAGQSALGIFARCTGSGRDFAGDCTSFSLYSGTAGGKLWTPVVVPAAFRSMSIGQASSAGLVISGRMTGYLLTPSGAVLSGPVSGGRWVSPGVAPCRPGPAQASGKPASAQLAAGPTQLLLTCDGQPSTAQVELYTSARGASWHLVGVVPVSGSARSLASAAAGQVVLATTAGISYSSDDGKTWHAASIGGGTPAGGFSYVGMTTGLLGVAVPANARLGEIFVTSNGGQTWRPSPIAS